MTIQTDDGHDDDAFWDGQAETDDVAFEEACEAIIRGDQALACQRLREWFKDPLANKIADEVLSLLDAQRTAEALARASLYVTPKFVSVAACDEAYAKAMENRP